MQVVPWHMWVAPQFSLKSGGCPHLDKKSSFRFYGLAIDFLSIDFLGLQVSYENTSQDHRQPPLIIQVSITYSAFVLRSVKTTKCSHCSWQPFQHGLFGRKENFTSLGKQIHHLTDTKYVVLLICSWFRIMLRSKFLLNRRSIILPDLRNHGESPPSNFMSLRWV